MVQQVLINDDDYYVPDANQLITENDTFEQAEQRTQLLADRLRAMGVDPETL